MSHITIAISEKAFQRLFEILRDNPLLSIPVSNPIQSGGDFENLHLEYQVAFHLEAGTVDFTDNDTIKIEGLEIKWDLFKIDLTITIQDVICFPPVKICTLVPPFFFQFCTPQVCLPHIPIHLPTLDLSDNVSTSVSIEASPVIKHKKDPSRPPGMSYLDAEEAQPHPVPDKWQIFIDPKVDLQLFIADVIDAILEQAFEDAIHNALPLVPDFFIDGILAILGPLNSLISDIALAPLKTNEWFAKVIGFDLFLIDKVTNSIVEGFAEKTPILQFEDPFPIMPKDNDLIPIKIPIKNPSVLVNTDEMTINADIGVLK